VDNETRRKPAQNLTRNRYAAAFKNTLATSKKHNNMKQFLIIILTILTCYVYGQDKYNYVSFNELTEVSGTEYIIATIENKSKIETKSKYLLFINTQNGRTKQVDLPKDSYIRTIQQIQIDNLNINKVILVAKTVNLNNNKGIDWNDPQQVFILSTNGENKTQLTENGFFVRTWTTNEKTGTIVITGHYDSNSNGKYDKTDKNEILIFDLKTEKLKTRI